MEKENTNTKVSENELDAKYILTLFNEFWSSRDEGSIKVAVTGTKPMIISNVLIFDYIKNNIDVGNYRNEYEVFKHFICTLVEQNREEEVKSE